MDCVDPGWKSAAPTLLILRGDFALRSPEVLVSLHAGIITESWSGLGWEGP